MESVTIRELEFFSARSPLSRPIADSTHRIEAITFVVARLRTGADVVGEGYLLAFDYSPEALRGAVRDVRERASGCRIDETGVFLQRSDAEEEYFGTGGVQRWTSALVNIAMWDARAKSLGVPVWRLFGACRDSVPVYGSGGWLSYSLEELIEEVTGYAKRGFGAVKMKVGSPETERDVERIAKVREAVGPAVRVMVDANQGLSYPGALSLARKADRYGLDWFEEPLPHDDFAGYAKLREATGIPLAMGEREYDTVALRELASRGALDLWQPDILRIGGVERWRESAAAAAAWNIPVLPHYYKEYDVPLLCTIPNGLGAESFDWVDPIIDRPLRIEGGIARPSEQPGWGFSFVDRYLEELR